MDNKPRRTLVIGDIHGGLKALEQCLERSNYQARFDKLIFLGDYVDGWSESAGLVELLLGLQYEAYHKPIFLRGNHDQWFEVWINTGEHLGQWSHGGLSTAHSYSDFIGADFKFENIPLVTGRGEILIHKVNLHPSQIPSTHSDFFKGLQDYYYDGGTKTLYVHAGIDNSLRLDIQLSDTFYCDRTLVKGAVIHKLLGIRGPNLPKGIYRVILGHTNTMIWGTDRPLFLDNVIAMDTAAGFEGRLTIMDVDTLEYWQSDIVQTLYPDEYGRE